MLSPEELAQLSQLLDARAGVGRKAPPKLRLVVPPTPKLLDPISRDAHLRRVQHLKRAYNLDWLVDQETFDVASVSCLEDCDLIRLLTYMERARECILDGVSFDDAGLVRSITSPAAKVLLKDPNAERSADQAAARAPQRATPHVAGSQEPPF